MKASSNFLSARWNWRALLICNLTAFALFASWLHGPGKALWRRIDYQVFARLNFPLTEDGLMTLLWALTNSRLFDVVTGIVLVALLCRHHRFVRYGTVRFAVFGAAGIVLLSLIFRVALEQWVHLQHWDNRSPSLIYDGAVRLTHLYDFWKLKDSSASSFPGDHTGVLMIWALFLSMHAKRLKVLLLWVLVIVFSLPRLVAGAHFLSDDIVGGGFIALLGFGWGYFTPYAARFSNFCDRIWQFITRRPSQTEAMAQ